MTSFIDNSGKINELGFLALAPQAFEPTAQSPLGNSADLGSIFGNAARQSRASTEWDTDGPTWLQRNSDWLMPIVNANEPCFTIHAACGALRILDLSLRNGGGESPYILEDSDFENIIEDDAVDDLPIFHHFGVVFLVAAEANDQSALANLLVAWLEMLKPTAA